MVFKILQLFIKKLVSFLKNLPISILHFTNPLSREESYWNKLMTIEKTASIINHLLPFLFITLFVSLAFIVQRNLVDVSSWIVDPKTVLLILIVLTIIGRILEQLENYQLFTNLKLWPQNIANIFFDVLFIVIVFDLLYQDNVFENLKEILSNRSKAEVILVFLVPAIAYTVLFFGTGKIRRSLYNLIPDFKRLIKSNKLWIKIIQFIFLTIYITMFFAVLHYLSYVILGSNSYLNSSTSFLEFIFFSFSIFYKAAISSLFPNYIIPKIITGTEAITSYLLLVVFIAYLLNFYLRLDKDRGRRKHIRKKRLR